jgi:hypothetical protein
VSALARKMMKACGPCVKKKIPNSYQHAPFACRTELRQQLEHEREQAQDLLCQEASSRERVEQESAATKAAVEEAIKDLEALDSERTELRQRLQV